MIVVIEISAISELVSRDISEEKSDSHTRYCTRTHNKSLINTSYALVKRELRHMILRKRDAEGCTRV